MRKALKRPFKPRTIKVSITIIILASTPMHDNVFIISKVTTDDRITVQYIETDAYKDRSNVECGRLKPEKVFDKITFQEHNSNQQ